MQVFQVPHATRTRLVLLRGQRPRHVGQEVQKSVNLRVEQWYNRTMKPTREQLKRWMPVLRRAVEIGETQGPLHRLKFIAEYATRDAEFLDSWNEEILDMPEPIRHRALSFVARVKARGGSANWDFVSEFRRSFNLAARCTPERHRDIRVPHMRRPYTRIRE